MARILATPASLLAAVAVVVWAPCGVLATVGASCADISGCDLGEYCVSVINVCANCPSGQYRSSLSQTQCQTCAAGLYSPGRTVSCVQCDEGYFTGSSGKTECTECGAGRYSDGKSATVCDACNSGLYQDGAGQSECKDCTAGAFVAVADWLLLTGVQESGWVGAGVLAC
jgi:hypothetical protein